jgi:carbonic anhydrase
MKTLSKEDLNKITPKRALQLLKNGNRRFVENLKKHQNLIEQVVATSNGQFPFAVILGCVDSRVPVELVFDEGIGDLFSIRIAGNIVNDDIIASLEYACRVIGSKLIVVLGHTDCGAIRAACENVKIGKIPTLIQKIKPAIKKVACNDEIKEQALMDLVAQENVMNSIKEIKKNSTILKELENKGEIDIIHAMYCVQSGIVTFNEG